MPECSCDAEELFVPPEKHRFGKPDIGAQQMPAPRQRAQIEVREGKRPARRQATDEVPAPVLEGQRDRRAAAACCVAREIRAEPMLPERALDPVSQCVRADLAKERDARPERRRSKRAIGAAPANCLEDRGDLGFAIAEQELTGPHRSRLHIAVNVSDDAQRTADEDALIQHARSSFSKCISKCSITR